MEDILSKVDWILVSIIVGFFAIIFILNIFNKFLQRHKIVRIVVIGLAVLALIVAGVWYFFYYNDLYNNTGGYYVYGRITGAITNDRMVQINSIRTNLSRGGDGMVMVKIPKGTKIIDSKTNSQIKFGDLFNGDTIQIYCEELKDGEEFIKADKVILKQQ